MRGRSLILLVVAIGCGLATMYGVMQLQGSRPEEAQILVASRDLNPEEMIKEDMVKLTKVPLASVPAGSFSNLRQVADRWPVIKILAGEPIVEPKLAAKGAPPGLPALIPKGKRAFALEVNEQTGVSGFVMPNHHVDVIQSQTHPDTGQPAARTILEDVQVLASGQTTTRPEDKSIIVRTVTLALTPEEVDKVVAAKTKGPLSLALRGLDEPPPSPKTASTIEKEFELVAVRDLKPDDVIKEGMVELKEVPKDALIPGTLSRLSDASGRRVQIPIFAGEPILDTKLASKGAPPPPKVEMKTIITATRNLKRGEVIGPGMLSQKEVPAQELIPGAIVSLGDVLGRWAQIPIFAGEPILEAKLGTRGSQPPPPPEPVPHLDPNKRAVTIEVDPTTGVDGYLSSDSRVDVIYTKAQKPGGDDGESGGGPAPVFNRSTQGSTPLAGAEQPGRNSLPVSMILLQNVKVLKVSYMRKKLVEGPDPDEESRRTEAEESGSGVGGGLAKYMKESWAVTLEVPAEVLNDFFSAKASGTLTLALREPGDHDYFIPPRDESDVWKLEVVHGAKGVEPFLFVTPKVRPGYFVPGAPHPAKTPPRNGKPTGPLGDLAKARSR